jgi:small-conductance mechanosensitive channel
VFVASDLRFAILKAFQEKGIVIPLPSVVGVTR